MIRRAHGGNEVTDDMVTKIRQAVEPWRIVLFGSRARGDFRQRSDYDLYVEVKALLVSRRVRPERTHELTHLLAALRQAGCALRRLDGACALLTEHAIKPRYATGLSLTVDDAERAFAAANRLIEAIRAELPRSAQ